MWDWRLVYGGGEAHGLEGFADANGAMQEHKWAISGYVILLDRGAVSWCLKKQELITLLTTKSEYITTTHAVKELIWFQHLLEEIFQPLEHPNTPPLDNQSDIALAHSNRQFMPKPSISISSGISFTTLSKKALSSSFIVQPRT
jgi:hypothetical protein